MIVVHCWQIIGYGSIQLFLSCGSEVTIYSQLVGYGMGEGALLSSFSSFTFVVDSWGKGQEELFSEVEVKEVFFIFFSCFFIPSHFLSEFDDQFSKFIFEG